MIIYVDGQVLDLDVVIYEPFPEPLAEITQHNIEEDKNALTSESQD